MLAVFKGCDGSLVFRKNEQYHIVTMCIDNNIVLHAKEIKNICTYGSVESFLRNWQVITI